MSSDVCQKKTGHMRSACVNISHTALNGITWAICNPPCNDTKARELTHNWIEIAYVDKIEIMIGDE